MKKTLTASIALALIFTAVSCTSVGVVATNAALYLARVVDQLRTTEGSAIDHDTLCAYYKAHYDEVEAVRAYAKAHWTDVPEQYKPALLAINEQLNACDATVSAATANRWQKGEMIEHSVTEQQTAATPAKKTTARALLTAMRRSVALYQKLRAAGIL